MYFKLSNTAEMKVIESEANALFRYPNLYEPKVVISGLTEVSIPVITMQEPNVISLSIWGLLPRNYQDDWELFQHLTNTLNIHIDTMDSELWYADALEQQRCVLPVTGFFTSILKDGEIQPYFIESRDERPLYLAGIYSTLEDGFITSTILTGPMDDFLVKYQNLVNFMPMLISENTKDEWLDKKTKKKRAMELLNTPHAIALRAKPITKSLFNQDISYDSMLMPFDFPEH